MKNLLLGIALSATAIIAVSAPANAALLYQNTTATGDTEIPGFYNYSFGAVSGTQAVASFELRGYDSLDGVNFYEDDFTLSQNGTPIYKGSFDLGGGGSNAVFFAPPGSTFDVSPVSTGTPTFKGGLAGITVPVTLLASNTFTLSYDSLIVDHAGYQGIGDEGFGVNSFSVSSVPLPASLPMLGGALLLLAGIGVSAKRKTAAVASAAA